MGSGPEARLLERARSPQDAAALVRFDSAMALPLVLAAVLPILLAPGDGSTTLAAGINVAAWAVFVVDFGVHLRRLHGFLATWFGRFDLAVVVLTAPWFLVVEADQVQLVLVVRLARLARLVMAGHGARRLIERLGRVIVVAVAVVVVGAAAAYGAEHPTNPGFASYGDSLWWAMVTLATVGYGDIVPETVAGRVTATAVMITGVAVLGVLAGSLAGYFRLDQPVTARRSGTDDPPPADGTTPPGADTDRGAGAGPDDGTYGAQARRLVELADEVAELRRQVARLADGLHGAAPGDDPPGGPA